MAYSSDSTSSYDWSTFQSSGTSYSTYKVEVNWNMLYEIGYPLRIYLPPLPMSTIEPFFKPRKSKQFTGNKFKLGRSKK